MLLAAEKYEQANMERKGVDFQLPELMPSMFAEQPGSSATGDAPEEETAVPSGRQKRTSRFFVGSLFDALTPRRVTERSTRVLS